MRFLLFQEPCTVRYMDSGQYFLPTWSVADSAFYARTEQPITAKSLTKMRFWQRVFHFIGIGVFILESEEIFWGWEQNKVHVGGGLVVGNSKKCVKSFTVLQQSCHPCSTHNTVVLCINQIIELAVGILQFYLKCRLIVCCHNSFGMHKLLLDHYKLIKIFRLVYVYIVSVGIVYLIEVYRRTQILENKIFHIQYNSLSGIYSSMFLH